MAKLNAKKLPTYLIRLFSEISDIHYNFTHISSENLYLFKNNYARTIKFVTMLGLKIWNSVPSDILKKPAKLHILVCC